MLSRNYRKIPDSWMIGNNILMGKSFSPWFVFCYLLVGRRFFFREFCWWGSNNHSSAPSTAGEIIVTIAPRICEAKGKVVVLLQLRLELQNSRILFSDSAAMVLPRPRFAGAGVGCWLQLLQWCHSMTRNELESYFGPVISGLAKCCLWFLWARHKKCPPKHRWRMI